MKKDYTQKIKEYRALHPQHSSIPDHCLPVFGTKRKKSKTNEATSQVIAYIKALGGFAARVNTQGNYNTHLKKWVYSGSTKGAADICATIAGRTMHIELKVGKGDKLRPAQIKFKEAVEAAGAYYLVVKSFEQFKTDFEQIVNNIKTEK